MLLWAKLEVMEVDEERQWAELEPLMEAQKSLTENDWVRLSSGRERPLEEPERESAAMALL